MNPTVRGGPFWTPITPQTGSFFHAESHPIGAVLGSPGANPAFQATKQPIPVMIGMPALHLFEHRDRPQAGMCLEQRADLAAP